MTSNSALFIVFASLLSGAVAQYYYPAGWRPPLSPATYGWLPAPAPLLTSRANSMPMGGMPQPNNIQDTQGGIPVPPNRPPLLASPSPLPMMQPTRSPPLPPAGMMAMRPMPPAGMPMAGMPPAPGMPPSGLPPNVLSQIQAKRTAMLIARRRAMAAKMREEKKKKEAEAQAAAERSNNPFSTMGEAMMNFIRGSPPPGPLGSIVQTKSRMSNAVASGCMSAVDAENPMMSIIMPGGCDPKNDICPFTHRGRKCVEVNKGFGMCCPKSMTAGVIDIQASLRRMNALMEMFGA